MDGAGVCCERCPEATLASTRHIARRRLLKAAVFHPQAAAPAGFAFAAEQDHLARPGAYADVTSQAGHYSLGRADAANGRTLPADENGAGAGLAIPRQAGPRSDGPGNRGPAGQNQHGQNQHGQNQHGQNQHGRSQHGRGQNQHRGHFPQYEPAAARAGVNLYRAVTGQVIDVSPQVIVIGDGGGGGERRFALTADTRAWRGGPLDPSALNRGDLATIRLLPNRSAVADRIWANIGRVTGTIVGRDGDRLLVSESRAKPPKAVVIPAHARVKVQVRYPNLQRGYLLDIIGLRHRDYLEGLLPANPQPNYRSDRVQKDAQPPGRMADGILGSATWHDFADEPYGVLGVSYPAIDPAATCREDALSGYGPGEAPAFRQLPYLAVGTALTVRNECTGISCTLPVTGCAPMARLFNDRCVACANSPRGRVADLTVASFIALGGELEEGCFSTTLTIGR